MKIPSILFLVLVTISSCVYVGNTLEFQKEFDSEAYAQLAKEKGIDNERWIEILYEKEVNIRNFDKFKDQGIDLTKSYDNRYKHKSWALFTEVIVEGTILSEKENAASDVMFHTEYLVKVDKTLKRKEWEIADTVKLKLMYGPVGNGRYMAVSSAGMRYKVGEHLLLFLEPMEKAHKIRENLPEEKRSRNKINADRKDLNIYQPINKFTIKGKDIYHEGKRGVIGKKSTVFKEIKKVLSLNKIR